MPCCENLQGIGQEWLDRERDDTVSESIEYRNESGRFTVDKDGFLIKFASDSQNELRHAHFLPIRCDRAVIDLHIPEGVRFIGRVYSQNHGRYEGFNDMFILGEVTFPSTLLALRDQTFSRDIITRIALPHTLKQIGRGSFMSSLIYTLEIDKEILQYEDFELDPALLEESSQRKLIYGGRSFKESTIQEVRQIGKNRARLYPENTQIGIDERIDKLAPEAWIRQLMPEADVRRMVSIVLPDGDDR